MRILVAPDKFKGSLGAPEVARNIAAGLRDILPGAIIEIAPVADGGEGTAAVICDALDGAWIHCKVHDPLGRQIDAHYAWIDQRQLAVIEMSEAAGMCRLRETERDPLRTSTFGVGEMILDATKRGTNEIILGLGGSATNDGGFGMARALGFRFVEDENDKESTVLADLVKVVRIKRPAQLSLPRITAAADVRNPLLGERGATRVFGPQKGATINQTEILECALTHLANVVAEQFGHDFRDVAGAGAAGGLGFGLLAFCDATLHSGFEVVAEASALEKKIYGADVIVTGEGKLDGQTLEGKAPAGIARLARKHDKRVFAIVGCANDDFEGGEFFEAIFTLVSSSVTLDEAIQRAPDLLRQRARELGRTLG